jgi:hypothetical protein
LIKLAVLLKLIGVSLMAFVTAFIIKELQSNAALEWLLAKKTTMIACGPGVPNLKRIGNVQHKNHDPLNKDSGNDCAHQQVASALCGNSVRKRRLAKNQPC